MYLKSPGYHGYVTALCGEQGNYTVSGRCVPVLCGTPPRLPEAAARMEDVTRQNFSFGALVHYDCKKPRHGDVIYGFLLGFRYVSLQKRWTSMEIVGRRLDFRSLLAGLQGLARLCGRFVGELLARCLPTSRWDINGSCTEARAVPFSPS